jgi:iron(III) transport system permease protein
MVLTAPHPAPAKASPPGRSSVQRKWLTRAGYTAFLLVIGYLIVVPLVRLQSRAFADGGAGYATAFGQGNIGTVIQTTVALAVGSTIIALILGTVLAFAASRLPPRYGVLRAIPVLPIVMPAVANVVGWAFLLSPRPGYLNALLRKLPWWSDLDTGPVDIYSVPWIIILTGFGLTSFVYLFVTAGMQNISSEHMEAAQTSGSNSVGVFFRVVLPLLRPSLVYGGGVALLLGLGQFTAPLLLGLNSGVNVITTEMYRMATETPTDYGAAAAMGSPLLVFGILIVIAQKLLLGNQTRFVTHGGKAFVSTRRRSPWAVVTIVFYGFVALVLPLIGLLIVALSPFWSGRILWEQLTLKNFETLFKNSSVVEGIITSLVASGAAVLICLPLGFLAATLIVRGRKHGILRATGDFVTALPLGIPAVIFGVGFLLTYTQPPFVLYGTRTVIILVYITLMIPFATRMQMTAMLSLGESYREASATSGANALTTNLRIIVPLLRPTFFSAVALMFILLTHEFAASVLVRSATTQVMGTVLFDLWSNGSYPVVAAMALVMTAVTGLGVVVAMLLGGRDALSKL